MLSIDEAIEQFKYDAECNRADLDLSYAEDNEQVAEWLEELKALREEKSEFLIYAKDIAEANYEMGMEIGHNKAIDDAKSVILQTIDNEILVDTLHLRLEQLKE
mgnify:CR=1 FL=1